MKQTVIDSLTKIDKMLVKAMRWFCILLLGAMTVILTLSMVVRFYPFMSMHWFDEVLELMFAALVFYGAAVVWMEHQHFSVGDWISKYIASVRLRFFYRLLVELISLIFIAIFFKYSLDLTLSTEEQTTAFAMSKKWLYMCMPICGAIMLVYTIKNMYIELALILNPDLQVEERVKEDLSAW
ncbi:TRAP transporter small permease subunit [uncultured Propionivibrio sp.]|uniref:TRAP transporter small permease n=1 Tax=uncultured Propionivibrio sp. TaxID=426737 RepID=UPI0029C04A09|nr:TRAP transporter small permease subunit [uncultured Propionivibrio sp.]